MWRLAVLWSLGCSGDGNTTTDLPVSSNLVVTDASNYSYSGTVDLGYVELMPGADATFCWEDLTTTLRGNPLDGAVPPAELLFVQFSLSQEELSAKIENNTLVQSDSVYQALLEEPAGTCGIPSSSLGILGNPHDVGRHVDDGTLWLATIRNLEPRPDILMSKVVAFKDGATDTEIRMTDSCSTIDFTADLHTAPPVPAPAGNAEVSLDWCGVTVDASGNPFDILLADQLILGHVPTSEIGEVETQFVRLYEEADELYTLDVYGICSLSRLSGATDEAGSAFGGFTTDGTWLIGLVCTSSDCTSPAPMFLAAVDVAG